MSSPSPSPLRDAGGGSMPTWTTTPPQDVKAGKRGMSLSDTKSDALSAPSDATAAFEDGRITVCVRSRPLNRREEGAGSPIGTSATAASETAVSKEGSLPTGGANCLRFFEDGKTVMIFEGGLPPTYAELTREEILALHYRRAHTFTFDHAYDQGVPQDTVYADMGRPVLAASFLGFNTCIFAYGQTGSGKSYCMMGPDGGRSASAAPGIIPRLCRDLFAQMAEKKRHQQEEQAAAQAALERRRATPDDTAAGALSAGGEGEEVTSVGDGAEVEEEPVPAVMPPELEMHVYVSYLEIYREKVRCLLNPKGDNLKVRQHPSLGVYVEGLKEVPVSHEDQIMKLLRAGTESRHTASTMMNDTSSRSHAIFQLQLIQKRKSTTSDGKSTKTTELRARVNLVDLAGSERAKSTGAAGETLKEGAQINKSLSTLGLVISALAELSSSSSGGGGGGTTKHIPYRDSTLTFLLKESLGGNSKTYMLSTLSPATLNYEETLSTLRYADRAKQIVTRAFVNETAGDKRIRELENEVTRLREKIRLMMEGQLLRQQQMPQLPQDPHGVVRSGAAPPSPTQPLPPLSLSFDETPPLSSAASRRMSASVAYDEALDGSIPIAVPRRRSVGPVGVDDGTVELEDTDELSLSGSDGEPEGLARAMTPASSGADGGAHAGAKVAAASPAIAVSPVLDPHRSHSPGDRAGSLGAGSIASPTTMDMNALQSELLRAEEIIRQLNATDTEREQEVGALLEAYRARSTVKLNRTDPFLMNLDGLGDWVVAHLVAQKVHVGGPRSRASDGDGDGYDSSDENPEEAEEEGEWEVGDGRGSEGRGEGVGDPSDDRAVCDGELDDDEVEAAAPLARSTGAGVDKRGKPRGTTRRPRRSQYVTVTDTADEPLGCPHCTLLRRRDQRGGDDEAGTPRSGFVLRPREGHDTFLNGSTVPITVETPLESGDILTLGDAAAGPQLKFMDPSAPPPHAPATARGARTRARQVDRLLAGGEARTGSPGNTWQPTPPTEGVGAGLARPLAMASLSLTHTGTHADAEAAPSVSPRRSSLADSYDSLWFASDSGMDGNSAVPPPPASRGDEGSGRPLVPALALGSLASRTRPPVAPRAPPRLSPVSVATKRPTSGQSLARTDETAEAYFSAPVSTVATGVVESGPPLAGRVIDGSTRGSGSRGGGGRGGVPRGAVVRDGAASSVPGSAPARFVGRHTLLFLGPSGAGKTHCCQNLREPDRWYDFLSRREPASVRPTWGVARSIVDLDGGTPTASAWVPGGAAARGKGKDGRAGDADAAMSLALMELSGRSCFSLLLDQLPPRRVTYVLCFSLESNQTLQVFRHTLEHLLCQSDHRDACVVLMGTHFRSGDASAEKRTHRMLDELEQEVQNYFLLLQPNAELRPTVVGRFAVDNVARRVFSAGFARVATFPELLRWLGDHALQRCRNDLDFLNGRVPACCVDGLASMASTLCVEAGRWCVSSADYKARARAVHACYQDAHTLHVHTQLLAHWGLLVHRFRHAKMRAHVVVDAQWYLRLMACIACCGAASVETPDEMLLCTHPMMHAYDRRSLEFDPDDVILADAYGLLSRGVMTTKVLAALTHSLIEADSSPSLKGIPRQRSRPDLPGIIALFEACDYVIPGGKLCFSPSSPDARGDPPEADAVSPTAAKAMPKGFESFLLLPSTFHHVAPPTVVQHVSRLFTGPFYRFTFSMVPPFFFAKLVCRIANDVCSSIYVGPVQRWLVDADGPFFPLPTHDDTAGGGHAGHEEEALWGTSAQGLRRERRRSESRRLCAVVPGNHQFWSTAAYAVGAGGVRALLRIVHHSLFLSFNHTNSYRQEDSTFYESILSAVRSVVAESPGARCEESILCCQPMDVVVPSESSASVSAPSMQGRVGAGPARPSVGECMLESDPPCFYRPADENINSLEKVREREAYALQTARSYRPMRVGAGEPSDEDAEEEMPFLRNYVDQPLDADRFATLVDITSPMRFKVKERLLALLERLAAVREACEDTPNDGSDEANAAAEAVGSTLDALVDLLASIR